jgi:hypothetical protein
MCDVNVCVPKGLAGAAAVTPAPEAFEDCAGTATETDCARCCALNHLASVAMCDVNVCVPKGLAGHP